MQMANVIIKTKWGIDPAHSEIGFKVKHLMFANVRGLFREFEASIYTTEGDFLTSEIDCWINPASVDTGDKKRDEHLKSADFFDVENFREIRFTGNTFEQLDEQGHYQLYGDLTIKGISKQVKLGVEFGGMVRDPWGNEKSIFMVSGMINRRDWGLNWNAALEAGGVLVSENVWINCELELGKIE